MVAVVVEVSLALGRHGQQAMADTPEGTVAAIYRLCQGAHYDETGPYYLGGPETDAGMRVSICEEITEGRTISGWDVRDQTEATGDTVTLRTFNYRNTESKGDGRVVKWRLIRRQGRWRVAEVV
jgi:hypothetical protein